MIFFLFNFYIINYVYLNYFGYVDLYGVVKFDFVIICRQIVIKIIFSVFIEKQNFLIFDKKFLDIIYW